MKSVLSPDVLELFPDFVRGVVIGKGINNREENSRLIKMVKEAEKQTAGDETLEDIKNHPRINSWRQAYIDFGSNPNKFVSSIESLCKRVRKGGQLPYINTIVSLFNYISLKHIVPSGADDLDRAEGNLRLIRAAGDESFVPFNSDQTEHPDPGEVIYVDDAAVMCRRWNWRQGNQTMLLPDTTNIAINVDCMPPVGGEEPEQITGELADLLRELCGGEVSYFLLSAKQNEMEI